MSRLDVASIISICEDLELRRAAMPTCFSINNANGTKNNSNSPSSLVSATLLAAYLITDDLPAARMLCKRVTRDIRETTDYDLLHRVWSNLYKKLPAEAYPHLDPNKYTPELRPLILLLAKTIRERVFTLVTKAYTDVPLSIVSHAMGCAPAEAHMIATTAGWTVNASTGIASRPPITAVNRVGGVGDEIVGVNGLRRISTVADYVVNLERV
ncbi:hypothetical protein SeLEV6574_g02844 [Synchytrium endobioticum]|uniref:CSN8/PSMD8/EIF3K domain-containing protein n=1 Tax=Synchytrium endobioticum TaxID=286115 RepID=A0A507D6U1_9FUNG|nr:hypothetical protein SeLEV6574_g02844 [Synchytrium endobioticum]